MQEESNVIAIGILPAAPPLFQSKDIPESTAYVMDSYLMHVRDISCQHCGLVSTRSDLQEVWIYPLKTQHTAYRNLRPCTTMVQGFDLAIQNLEESFVPACWFCAEAIDQADLPKTYVVSSASAWAAALRAKAKQAQADKVVSLVAKRQEPTVDML